MRDDLHVLLSDGRRLAYAEFGDPAGAPVLWFHGSPSSRLEPLLIGDARLAALGLRVIAPDRPGMGGSTPKPGRGILDWPADVASLADALGLPRFGVLGNSGGAPYVAACCARIPERVRSAVIISGGWRMDSPEVRELPLVNRLFMVFAKRAPFLLPPMLAAMKGNPGEDPQKALAKMRGRVPEADYNALAAPGRMEALTRLMNESLRQGTKWAVADLRLYVRDFGFSMHDVRTPIAMFHGEADRNSPVALARRVASESSMVTLTTLPGAAHLSTLCDHFESTAALLR
jgi:pimeloyl-ACP methyl ester carboxylesterase